MAQEPPDPRGRERIAAFAKKRRTQGQLLGWSVDDQARTVTFLVPEHEPPSEYPARIAGYAVLVAPLPRARAQDPS